MPTSQKILGEDFQRSITPHANIAAVNNFADGIVEFVGTGATAIQHGLITGGTTVKNGIMPFFTHIDGSNPFRLYLVIPAAITNGDTVKVNVAGIDYSRSLLGGLAGGDGTPGIKYDGDRINQVIPGAELVSGAGDELGGPVVQVTPPNLTDGQRFLAVFEHNVSGGKMFALSPNNATGVPIPAFRTVTAVPVAGTMPGEAVLNTTNGTSWIWDGARWDPVVPPSIVPYPTDADVFADNAAAVGTYAFSRATGNLFVRFHDATAAAGAGADVWRQIGIRHFADVIQLTAAQVVDGSYAYVQNEGTFWIYKQNRWQIASTIQNTEAAIQALDPAIHAGGIGVAVDTGKLYVSDGAGWIGQPFRDYATEAALLADAPPDGTMAVALDTGVVHYYPNGVTGWISVNSFAIPVGANDPGAAISAVGDLFYNTADRMPKVFDGAGWQALGTPSQWTIGAIQQSLLDATQFNNALPPTERAKWRLCDGSDITGTALAGVLGANTLPDLRGAYLRMAGQNSNPAWNGGNLRAYQEDRTKRPGTAFTGTTNTYGNHTHSYQSGAGSTAGIQGGNWGGSHELGWKVMNNRTGGGGDHGHSVTINGGGDSETRPKTYTVNFFIKTD